MTDHKATLEQWADAGAFASDTRACLLELRARVEALEAAAHKHIVETSANILALASRVEALEAVQRPASKVYEISKPLKLTPEQAQHVRDLLAPNSKPTPNPSQIGRSLVNRVALAISGIEYGLERDEEAVNWASEARAAIREVAAWLRETSSAGWTVDQALFNLGECTYEDMGFEAKSVIAELLEWEAHR